MAVKPSQADVSHLVTLIADLARLIVADGTHLEQAADELARLYRSPSTERPSTIIPDLQSSFRALTEMALRIREETKSLQNLKTAEPANTCD